MAILETFPLHPGEGVATFVAAGIIKTPSAAEQFLQMDDPLTVPAITLGSFTLGEWAGNNADGRGVDHVYYPDRQMFGNSLGLPNPGAEGLERLRPFIAECNARGLRTIISVTNLPQENGKQVIPQLAARAAALNPTAIEVNLSCPNGKRPDGNGLHAPICYNPEASYELMQAVDQEVGDVVLGAKDAPHTTSPAVRVDHAAITDLMKAINPYVDFVTGINTIGNQDFPEVSVTGGKAGMSGPAVTVTAHDWLLAARSSLSPETAILSCGGVESGTIKHELVTRQALGAMLVGGAQQFWRAPSEARMASEWARQAV